MSFKKLITGLILSMLFSNSVMSTFITYDTDFTDTWQDNNGLDFLIAHGFAGEPAYDKGLTAYDDLVERNGLYYKKFTDVPFNAKVTGGSRQGSFKNGKEEGAWIYYWSNGQLWHKGDYKNGKKEGSWIYYHNKDGTVWHKGDYKNGKKEGSWIYYHNSGQLSANVNYKNGKQEGATVVYNLDGTVNKEYTGTYKDGEKISD
jgi:hypothetical protein